MGVAVDEGDDVEVWARCKNGLWLPARDLRGAVVGVLSAEISVCAPKSAV